MVEMTIVISEQKQEDQPYLWHENYYIVCIIHFSWLPVYTELLFIRNGLCTILWGINLLHIYAREVRWNIKFDSWYSSKICLCLSKKKWHSLHLLFFKMSTLKGDVRVNIFHFTIFFFWLYVKKDEYRIGFVCGNVIF